MPPGHNVPKLTPGGGENVVSKWCFHNKPAGRDINGIDVVGDTRDNRDLPGPGGRQHTPDDERRKEGVHLARDVVGFVFPQELHPLHVRHVEDVLVLLPRGPLRIAAIS